MRKPKPAPTVHPTYLTPSIPDATPITVTLTEAQWALVEQEVYFGGPHLNAAENRRLMRTAARKIHKARLAAREGK